MVLRVLCKRNLADFGESALKCHSDYEKLKGDLWQ